MKLMRRPAPPRWHPLTRVRVSTRRYQVWRTFIDAAYWNADLEDVKA